MKRVSGKTIPTNPYNQCLHLHPIFYQPHFIKRGKASIIQKLLKQKKLIGLVPFFFQAFTQGLWGNTQQVGGNTLVVTGAFHCQLNDHLLGLL